MGLVSTSTKISIVKRIVQFFFRHFQISRKTRTPATNINRNIH